MFSERESIGVERNRQRLAHIAANRNDKREVELANMIIEWAWFAGAFLFCLGVFAGIMITIVA